MPSEMQKTELYLLAAGVLLLASVVLGRVSSRSGVPVLVLFLGLGMLAGSEGIGRIEHDDYSLTFRVGIVALVLILFDGGLRTPVSVLRAGLAPAALLSTLGVVLTAGIVGAGAHLLGFPWTQGLLLGAIVSSTDAAAVFSVLRTGGVHLKERVGAVVELESGLNDPMAALLTVALVSAAVDRRAAVGFSLAAQVATQLAIGAAVGAAIGFGARAVVSRIRFRVRGLYPVFTLSLAFITYGCASLAFGSGLLAVYIAGVALGNSRLPSHRGLLRAHDFIAWTGQIVMFVVLGLLVVPSRVLAVAPVGLVVAGLLTFIARPVAVILCLLPFRFRTREVTLVAWVGLRGAVPIILAIIPVLEGVPGGEKIFDVVFFVVIVSALLQGGTTRALTHWLRLGADAPPKPAALVEIESARPLDDEILSFFIDPACAVSGARLAEVPFPEHAFVMLIVRAEDLVAPKGETVLKDGDHVFVFCPRENVAMLHLLFGRAEE